jgi:superfamily II RNA helicase
MPRTAPPPKTAALPLNELFPFKLDDFQLEAIARIDEERSVLVCAPTGSGKTVIAEYAIHQARAAGQRVFYTTPLKALSNQKFRDLSATLGEGRVGLLTGDVSINREAEVVVMTTEVFRNMLYGTTLGAVETSLRNVRFVILDEVHYMNDEQRGTVWEESIIYCPAAVQLVALSATVANAEDMAAWMNQVHGDTSLVTTDYRPVPLRFHYFDGRHLTPLMKRSTMGDHRPKIDPRTGRRLRNWEMAPDPDALVQVLAEGDMLPAIYFVFSRKGCDAAMLQCARLQLLREEEIDRVEHFLEQYVREYPSVADHPHLPYLFRGLAVHHAGLLPTWKVLVERLFQANLVKVVFATETLAAGINMPARTTVLASITKRGDQGHRPLTASEFLQMSGRAGRRGMDRVGHVAVVSSPYQTVSDAQMLASAPADPLGSHFTPTYGMVLNLLQRHTLQETQFLISRSFGEFLDEQRRARRAAAGPRRNRDRKRDEERAENAGFVQGNWQRFLRLRDVLQHYECLEGDHPTPRGVIAAAFRAEHELLVCEALLSGAMDGLTPPQFAAVATALVAEELRPSAWVKVLPQGGAVGSLQQIVRIAREMRAVQHKFRVEVNTRIFSDCSGLTQLWAEEADWDYLMGLTNLDEGDVVRIFRRTVDLLEQIQHAPMLDEALRGLARAAIHAMDREPVREVL